MTKVGTFSGPHLRAAALFQATKDARDYLTGVFVETHAGGVMLTATDGHAAIRVFDEKGAWPFAPAILRFDRAAIAAMKRGKGVAPRVRFEAAPVNGKRAQCLIEGKAHNLEAVAGEFPDVARVIPRDLPAFEKVAPKLAPWVAFDAELLHRFGRARVELDPSHMAAVQIGFADPTAPILVHLNGAPAFGVLMPLRAQSEVRTAQPHWCSKTPLSDERHEARRRVADKRAARIAPHSPKQTSETSPAPQPQRVALSAEEKRLRYEQRVAARRKLRAVIGWGVKLSDMSPTARAEAEARANEPLARVSLAAIAKGAKIKAPVEKAPPRLIFEARFRADLLAGKKRTTIRKASSHTARFAKGVRCVVEAPNGTRIGETTISHVEPNATPASHAERDALRAIYGKSSGPWVRLTFDRVKEPKAKPRTSRR